jgi:hypothetical protein
MCKRTTIILEKDGYDIRPFSIAYSRLHGRPSTATLLIIAIELLKIANLGLTNAF